MNVGVVVSLVVVAILLFKIAAEITTSKKECDGNCGENCKCKDK